MEFIIEEVQLAAEHLYAPYQTFSVVGAEIPRSINRCLIIAEL